MARRLVNSIAEPFEIARYHDLYREALLDLIDRKANGEEIPVAPAAKRERPETTDLMSALQASIEEVRERKGRAPIVDELPEEELLVDEGALLTEDLLLDDEEGETDSANDDGELANDDEELALRRS